MPAPRTEQRRRTQKQREDTLNEKLDLWLQDPLVLDALDPKEKARLIVQRLPKPVEIDQDFEKSLLGLGNLLETLPTVPFPSEEFGRLRGRIRKQQSDLKIARTRATAFRDRLKQADVDWGEKVELAYEEGQKLGAEQRSLAESLGLTVPQYRQWIGRDPEKPCAKEKVSK